MIQPKAWSGFVTQEQEVGVAWSREATPLLEERQDQPVKMFNVHGENTCIHTCTVLMQSTHAQHRHTYPYAMYLQLKEVVMRAEREERTCLLDTIFSPACSRKREIKWWYIVCSIETVDVYMLICMVHVHWSQSMCLYICAHMYISTEAVGVHLQCQTQYD